MSSHRRRRLAWFIASAAVVVFGALVLTAFPRRHVPEPMVLLKRPFSPPLSVRDRIEGWIPRASSWAWSHRTLDLLFGRRKTVKFDAEAFTFRAAHATGQVELELGQPAFSIKRNGLAVWFLPGNEITALRARLEREVQATAFRARVTTADGIQAGLYTGSDVVLNGVTNLVGVQEDYFSRTVPGGTDLFLSMLFSEIITNSSNHLELNQPAIFIRTNADFSVRLQVPIQRGIILISHDSFSDQSAALLLDPL